MRIETNFTSYLHSPKPLELSAPDELVALDNLDVLRQNGFEIEVADDAISDTRHHRLKLVAQPVSKSTVFDLRDLEEIIHLLQDQPQGQMVRCSKARAMFAMRACRKSIMVGMPLTTKQMTTVRASHEHTSTCVLLIDACVGDTTYGHYASTLELSSRKTNDATSF